MKRIVVALFLAAALTATAPMAGCGSQRAEKAQEYKKLGIRQMEEASYQEAAESFQKALDQSLGFVGAQEKDLSYYKALALFKAGDTQAAIDTYTALADFDEGNWEVYFLRGNAYLQEGKGKLCLQDFNRAVSLNKKDIQLLVHIGESLMAAGYEEKGISFLEQALDIKPKTADDYAGQGYSYFLTGDSAQAEADLQQAADQGSGKALLYLGQVYMEEKDTEQARACFEQYREKYQKDADALSELGQLVLSLGDPGEAVTCFEQALSAVGKNGDPEILRSLVIACEQNGDFAGALEHAQAYLEQSPQDADMQHEAEFLETRVRKTKSKKAQSEENTQNGNNSQSDNTQSGDNAQNADDAQSEDGQQNEGNAQSEDSSQSEDDTQNEDGSQSADDAQSGDSSSEGNASAEE